MTNWGAFIKSDDGSLLVTPDTPCYEFVGEYSPWSRSGNVNTYDVPLDEYPLIFINIGANNSAGILAVETVTGGWRISVLASVNCSILVFRRISGAPAGYGMAVYGANGQLMFDSSRNVLNVRNAANLSEGGSFAASSGVDSVSYTCGPVWPSQTQSERWEFVNTYIEPDRQYICTNTFECNWVQECSFRHVCRTTSQFICRIDFSGRQTCSFEPVQTCGFENVCEQVQRCGFVERCQWIWINNTYDIYARVRRTDWVIRRGVAQINSGSVSFNWLVHKSGYYDDVLYLSSSTISSVPPGQGIVFVPPGYMAPDPHFSSILFVQGELNRTNTYPYTASRANQLGLTCLTSVRSDYV